MNPHNLPKYIGNVHPNCDYHHGQIYPARGVKCWQISRGNRDKNMDDKTGYTYKHQPCITYFSDKFFVQYLTNPEDEHSGAGISILASSEDGKKWDDFQISFPKYKIPTCTIEDYKGNCHIFDGTTYAYMHQRMSFFKSKDNRMLVLGFYGWSPHPWMTNWDNYGIGRVVRELYKDGTLGNIYFIRPTWQGGWNEDLLNYPMYTKSGDVDFIKICDELLSNNLYVQQWAEENGDMDELIKIKHSNKEKYEAFCWYHVNDKTIIGMWKHSLVARSDDNGKTWSEVTKVPSLVMSGQKVWAEKTSDNRYAMVYNPTLETQHRYPLCITTSDDGLNYDEMLLVHGQVPPMKYKGFWKDIGPQYVRGMIEAKAPDGNLWVAYSVNKEDIWVAEIPVPIGTELESDISDEFNMDYDVVKKWNIYSPKWANVYEDETSLVLTDEDLYDYAYVERTFKAGISKEIKFTILPEKIGKDGLYIELANDRGITAIRLIIKDSCVYSRTVTNIKVCNIEENEKLEITLNLSCLEYRYSLEINNKKYLDNKQNKKWLFMSAVNEVSRFILRTKPVRRGVSIDEDPEGKPDTPLENCEEKSDRAKYKLYNFYVTNN